MGHLSGSRRMPRRTNYSYFDKMHEPIKFFTSSYERKCSQPDHVSLYKIGENQLHCSRFSFRATLTLTCDVFRQFQRLIINYAKLVPPNEKHDFWTMNIRPRCWCGMIFCVWRYCNVPIFCTQYNGEISVTYAFPAIVLKQTTLDIS